MFSSSRGSEDPKDWRGAVPDCSHGQGRLQPEATSNARALAGVLSRILPLKPHRFRAECPGGERTAGKCPTSRGGEGATRRVVGAVRKPARPKEEAGR